MGVCPDHRGELPDELADLGARLEAATTAQIARRGRVRRVLLGGACAVLVGVPVALTAASTDLAPSTRPATGLVRADPTTSASMASAAFVLDRVPDEGDAAGGRPCVMVPDCRSTMTAAARYP